MTQEPVVDVVMILMYVAVVGAMGATAFSLWRATRSREQSWLRNRIAVGVSVLTAVTLLLSYLIGGSVPDMFIATVVVLLVIALLAICLSIVHTKYLR